jgi:2-amino-4-hydroxy-6-hydroxymethyldihydropteridine diphosphokinase
VFVAKRQTILVGLGANLTSPVGAPEQTIRAAISYLEKGYIEDVRVSSYYRSTPVPATGQPDFVNVVLVATTSLAAQALLDLFQATETQYGRRPAERWSARTLDIDLLAYGNGILPNADSWNDVVSDPDPAATLSAPVVPHPRLHKRAFVVKPLIDIAPEWRHPVLGKTISDLKDQPEVLEQWASVRKISVIKA